MARHDKEGIGQDVCDKAGVSRNYFFMLRQTNKECYEFMRAFAPHDMAKAYHMFQDYRSDITQRACDIYYELEDLGLLYDFGRYLVKHGVYGNHKSYRNSSATIFKSDGIKFFSSLQKVARSNELYKEYMKCQNIA